MRADLIVTHGSVRTMEPGAPRAEAIAIAGDKIMAVGGNEEITELAGPGTGQINAARRTVMPGIVDAHTTSGSAPSRLGVAGRRGQPGGDPRPDLRPLHITGAWTGSRVRAGLRSGARREANGVDDRRGVRGPPPGCFLTTCIRSGSTPRRCGAGRRRRPIPSCPSALLSLTPSAGSPPGGCMTSRPRASMRAASGRWHKCFPAMIRTPSTGGWWATCATRPGSDHHDRRAAERPGRHRAVQPGTRGGQLRWRLVAAIFYPPDSSPGLLTALPRPSGHDDDWLKAGRSRLHQ